MNLRQATPLVKCCCCSIETDNVCLRTNINEMQCQYPGTMNLARSYLGKRVAWVEDSSLITWRQHRVDSLISLSTKKIYSPPNTRRTGCRLNLSTLRKKIHPGWPFANHNMHHPKKEKTYLHLPFLVVLNSCCSGLTLYHPLKSILHVKLTSSQKQEGVLSFVSIICSYCCLLCDVTLFQ